MYPPPYQSSLVSRTANVCTRRTHVPSTSHPSHRMPALPASFPVSLRIPSSLLRTSAKPDALSTSQQLDAPSSTAVAPWFAGADRSVDDSSHRGCKGSPSRFPSTDRIRCQHHRHIINCRVCPVRPSDAMLSAIDHTPAGTRQKHGNEDHTWPNATANLHLPPAVNCHRQRPHATSLRQHCFDTQQSCQRTSCMGRG